MSGNKEGTQKNERFIGDLSLYKSKTIPLKRHNWIMRVQRKRASSSDVVAVSVACGGAGAN